MVKVVFDCSKDDAHKRLNSKTDELKNKEKDFNKQLVDAYRHRERLEKDIVTLKKEFDHQTELTNTEMVRVCSLHAEIDRYKKMTKELNFRHENDIRNLKGHLQAVTKERDDIRDRLVL